MLLQLRQTLGQAMTLQDGPESADAVKAKSRYQNSLAGFCKKFVILHWSRLTRPIPIQACNGFDAGVPQQPQYHLQTASNCNRPRHLHNKRHIDET
jgi:hypothetical protein